MRWVDIKVVLSNTYHSFHVPSISHLHIFTLRFRLVFRFDFLSFLYSRYFSVRFLTSIAFISETLFCFFAVQTKQDKTRQDSKNRPSSPPHTYFFSSTPISTIKKTALSQLSLLLQMKVRRRNSVSAANNNNPPIYKIHRAVLFISRPSRHHGCAPQKRGGGFLCVWKAKQKPRNKKGTTWCDPGPSRCFPV